MTKYKYLIAALILALVLAIGFSFSYIKTQQQGSITQVNFTATSSTIYTIEDFYKAANTVENTFKKEYTGCTLLTLSYTGDLTESEQAEYLQQYAADEVLILTSSFTTGDSGGDGSLNPNDIYTDYLWILARNEGEDWHLADRGY
jgi:hypothetical protein